MTPNILYSDGSNSLRSGFCGWAVVGIINGIMTRYYGHDKGTNQFAELMGFVTALRLVPPYSEAVIFTDSQYVINSLTTYRKAWEANGYRNVKGQDIAHKQIVIEGHKLLDVRPNVQIRWVPGHKGVEGNEMADQLAKAARYLAEGKLKEKDVNGVKYEKTT